MNGDSGILSNDQPFEIPELPAGEVLKIELLSNWGDEMYIGLNAVEVFSETGKRVDILEITCSKGGNVNSLAFDAGMSTVWRTYVDDLGRGPDIILKFDRIQKVAMIRIWNYNESRVHAQIGVKSVKLSLDSRVIFCGDINPAYKSDTEFEPMGDTVLFTTDEGILEAIAENDICLLPDALIHQSSLERVPLDLDPAIANPFRPMTGEISEIKEIAAVRPHSENSRAAEDDFIPKVKVIHFDLISNWGHQDLIGLTGIGFIGPGGSSINLKYSDVVILTPGSDSGAERLLNGQNLGRNPSDMWLTPYNSKKPTTVTIQFSKPISLIGISIWNYNASPEASYAGVKYMNVYVNGKATVNNVLLRKAPVIFQLKLLSTWGDEFYIGLNGIELYDRKDEKIRLKTHNLAAFPESVNILPAVEGDPRTSENLITEPNNTDNPAKMWLTPLLPNRCARVFFIFDVPTFLSRVILYNYRKTPTRGVRHVSLSVDDIIVFSGEIPQSSAEETGILSIDLRDF